MRLAKDLFLALRQRRASPIERARRKFLRYFPRGFEDSKYYDWERGYKLEAHQRFDEELNKARFAKLLKERRFTEIGAIAARIESRTNLLFSFEKMAFRDAVKTDEGAKIFAKGLFDLLHGKGDDESKFEKWCGAVGRLPRKQTRVLTHPVVTIFPFIAAPHKHIFLKPMVTKKAAAVCGVDFAYESRPSWQVYSQLLGFAGILRRELKDLKPKDMIDLQSFIWVQGSSEYP